MTLLSSPLEILFVPLASTILIALIVGLAYVLNTVLICVESLRERFHR